VRWEARAEAAPFGDDPGSERRSTERTSAPWIVIPTLRTERLLLRPFRGDDVDAYAAMCADPLIMRNLGEGRTLSRAETWRQVAFFLGHWHLRGHGMWAVEERESGDLVGRVGFLEPEGWPGFELGWALRSDRWGRGYATEAARTALEFARTQLGRSGVISLIYPDNQPSIRVAERLGETLQRETELFGRRVLVYGTEIEEGGPCPDRG
jgi:RimJ/RimL family protein N-acetyltransferase